MSSLISIIMPCYNSSAHLEEAVVSALGQSYSNVELLVVDDGSTDNTPKILQQLTEKYRERLRTFSQQNKGPYPARNLALSHAKGEYIVFLDSDDYWDTKILFKLYNAIQVHDVDVAYCGWQNVGEHTPGDRPYIPPRYEEGDIVKQFLHGCPWPIHAALIKRHIIEAIDGFSTRYFSSMDYDLWLRILTVTNNIKLLPEVLAFYRWHSSGQISAVKWRQVLDAWNVRRDFISNNPKLIAHLDKAKLRKDTDDFLLKNAYKAFWQRDLDSAQTLFRKALSQGAVSIKDLKYTIPSLLPRPLYCKLISLSDHCEQDAQP